MSTSSSAWAEYKQEIICRIVDFSSHYASLERQKPSTGGWVAALCPFHDDKTPSFAFHKLTGNWKCHAGCGEGSVFDFESRQQGVDFMDAMLAIGDDLGVPRPTKDNEPRAVYDYKDANGKVLFQVLRYPGKKFRQRRPDGQGGWIWKLDEVQRVLYRMPELLLRSNERVYVVEGEKDADRLASLGLLATTNSTGANNWKDQYAETLAGRDVAIIPDNDTAGLSHAMRAASSLVGKANTIKIVQLPDLPPKGDVSDWLNAGGDVHQLESLVAAAANFGTHFIIETYDRPLRDILDDAWSAVLQTNEPPRLFSTAGGPSRLRDFGHGPQIELLDERAATSLLARAADWIRTRGNNSTHTKPPKEAANELIINPHPKLPILDAIVAAPVFTANGRLLRAPGYDAESHLWYEPMQGFVLPAIPDMPLVTDVAEAVRLLTDELLGDFPFAAESDMAHAVAAVVLPFVRWLICGCTPIHEIEAPAPGTGKTLLADLISTVAMGRTCEATTLTRDENESRKKITALLIRGSPIVLIDNVRHEFDSAQMAAMLTTEMWSDRILGQSRMIEIPNRAAWLITANNPKLSLEIARRSIRIRLVPHEERPWERGGFRHRAIKEWATAERPRLVWAVLTLVQNWIAAGRPSCDRPFGSFERWSAVVGGILQCADIPGFLDDRNDFYAAADTDGQEWRTLVEAWATQFGQAAVSATDLVKLAEERDLLTSVLGDKSDGSKRARLGRALSGQRDRHIGGYCIELTRDDHAKSTRYRLRSDLQLISGFHAGNLREVGQ